MIGKMIWTMGLTGGTDMKGLKAKFGVAVAVIISIWIGLAGLFGLLKPVSNGCVMTYMYPTYIPISTPENVSSVKYGLYLYHEGWRKIDFNDHLKKLNGVPVLFIPGNGGSYKQVRSLGAESDRAYQGGPLEWNFYQDSPSLGEGLDIDLTDILLPSQYTSMLDWFAVDLEGEHSAMDGQILQEHTEYVVYAIHRILDQYKESHDARAKEGASMSGSLPKSVILVGHSMGGFVARAAVVHPHLRKFAVETVLTLSTPHQSPPVALQPSLGHYYARVNQEWRKGYEVPTFRAGHYLSDPLLSHVVIVSISGGYNDYQVRSKLESLDGIVPSTHGFMISSTGVKNVWLSMEHQVILWCNQLVVQVSHTLLSLMDSKTGRPFSDVRHRLGIFMKMLHSGIPQNFISSRQLQLPQKSDHFATNNGKSNSGSRVSGITDCPSNSQWSEDGLERDLYIQTNTVTVLAMDGRRRWLDIQKLGQDGKNHFVFVTNLSPCSGVRLHLWREKGTSGSELSANKRVVEVTSKMVHIPSGPAPRQIEPGSQTEQAPPSAVFWLGPQDMLGFRFLTISVAPRPTISGRPPPAASMGVGQFFNPKDGERVFSPHQLIHSLYSAKDVNLKEDHPLTFNLTFSVSLGLLPVSLSLTTTGCGIKKSEFPVEESGDEETSRLCRLRCFPPVALAWDATSGLHVFPNLYSETIVVDSSPALWTSSQESDKTTVLLLVDPHCSYKSTFSVSFTAAAGRFLLLYFSQISGLCFAVVFFALMRQADAWELDQAIPSVLSAVESNLRMPRPFFFLAALPILFAVLFSCLSSQSLPPIISFSFVSILCYIFANGAVVVLILSSQLLFYVAGTVHVFIKKRWQGWEGNFCFSCVQWFINIFSRLESIKVVRILRVNPLLITLLAAIALVCLVHPALGLFVLLVSHALCCHSALSSFLMASFYSHVRNKEFYESGNDGVSSSKLYSKYPVNETCTGSPESTRSYGDTQLEIFHHRHGLLVLHMFAALMFVPSLVAWLQRIGIGQSFPWFWDSVLCVGVILHGLCDSKPEFNFFLFPIPGIPLWEIRLSFAYLLAGYFSYLSALALAPYRAFYAMAAIGIVSFTFRIIQLNKRKKGETYHRSRKHSHRH
ncbi:Negative regulator of COPII vesicle formation [Handroanthus impetiginosus]|uniref:GPI inositol-deacylase n=1 Tax=Handroanthus impetiginosus TaxID=429701 RepID=A0A2G9G549_9LAMI|nr:Negative regulator of COPII vesicle formation [Handroanthus impetiginosus]